MMDPTNFENRPVVITIKTSVRLWQRKKVCAMAIKHRSYKMFKNNVKDIQVARALNEHIQRYAGKKIPSRFSLRLKLTRVAEKYNILVDKWLLAGPLKTQWSRRLLQYVLRTVKKVLSRKLYDTHMQLATAGIILRDRYGIYSVRQQFGMPLNPIVDARLNPAIVRLMRKLIAMEDHLKRFKKGSSST